MPLDPVILTHWNSRFRRGKVPSWIEFFLEDPSKAIEALVLRRYDLGQLAQSDPEDLLADWSRVLGSEFIQQLDNAVLAWSRSNWRRFERNPFPLAQAWLTVFRTACVVPGLKQTTGFFTGLIGEVVDYLEGYSTSRSLNPLGWCFSAIGAAQTDRQLVAHWQQWLALPPGVRYFQGSFLIDAVAAMPAAPPTDSEFRMDVAQALLRIGQALHQQVDSGVLEEADAAEEFEFCARRTVLRREPREKWTLFWANRRAMLTKEAPRLWPWIVQSFPEAKDHPPSSAQWVQRPDLGAEADHVAFALSEAFTDQRCAQAEQILHEQRKEAELKQTEGFIVRTLCSLATAAIKYGKIKHALRWASEAHERDPQNPRTWEKLADAWRTAREFKVATAIAWESVERFAYALRNWLSLAEALLEVPDSKAAALVLKHAKSLLPPESSNDSQTLRGRWERLSQKAQNASLMARPQPKQQKHQSILALLAEARFFRHWVAANPADPERERWLRRAEKLLATARELVPSDSRLVAEDRALALLRHPSLGRKIAAELTELTGTPSLQTASLLVLAARCEREDAQRRGADFHTERDAILLPAEKLAGILSHGAVFEPCANLVVSRNLASLHDGADLLAQAHDGISKLAGFARRNCDLTGLASLDDRLEAERQAKAWAANQVRSLVFAGQNLEEDIAAEQVPEILARISKNADLDRFEDEMAASLAAAVVDSAQPALPMKVQ